MLISDKIINHNPNIDDKVITRYNNTLSCYKKEFNEDPPSYIWPVIKPTTIYVTIYIIDGISIPGKKIEITTPTNISYQTLKNNVSKILKISGLIGLYGKTWNGRYDKCFESDILTGDKQMTAFGMQNGSQYLVKHILGNLGC